MNLEFVAELEKAGYFTGLPADNVETLKAKFNQRGWLGIFEESHRFFAADAESLAEGGIGRFIKKDVEPFLTAQGVHIPEIVDEPSDHGYVVRVGGVPHEIYDSSESKNPSGKPMLGHDWGLSMTRGFKVVNELLATAGSPERVYAINGGNDLFAIFLTPELFRIVMNHPGASPKGGPYQPTEEYPWYGEPQEEGRKTPITQIVIDRPAQPVARPWLLWQRLVVAFLLGCVLLGLKLLLFKQ